MKCEMCGAPSTMRCPTCAKLGLPDSYFCSQAHFKAFWAVHKLKHSPDALRSALLAAARGPPPSESLDERFAGYRYTGGVRKGALSPMRAVPAHIPRPDYAETGDPAEEYATRRDPPEVKTAAQIAGMREACRVAREVLDAAARAVRVGATTDEIDRVVHEAAVEREAYPSPLNYRGFPKSVCTSVNEVVCHGIPDKRELQDGDIVNVDVTTFYRGFHGDLNETFPVGSSALADEASKRLIRCAYDCMMEGIAAVRPGVSIARIGDVISRRARADGFSVVREYCGHGIGRCFHCNPTVPHYANNGASDVMRSGNTFTIEPMINAGSFHDTVWPDEWTVVTQDGKRSAQFEHTILVTDTGCEILTARTDASYPFWFLA